MAEHLDPPSMRLLDALMTISSDLELETVLRRIVESAIHLTGARYGALGVLRDDEAPGDTYRLSKFIPVGLTEAEIAAIDHWPHGEGVLGALIDDPRPIRLDDISAHAGSAGMPAGHPVMRTFLGVPLRVRGEVYGNLYLTDKAGGAPFDEADEAIVTALAGAAGIVVENAHLFEESRRRETWLQASAEVATSLISGDDTLGVLALVAARGREMVDADVAAVVLPRDENTLTVEAADGDSAADIMGMSARISDSLVGTVYTTARWLIVDDARSPGAAAATVLDKAGMRSGLMVPLGSAEHVRGVLVLGRRPGRLPFGDGTVPMVRSFADQAALALALAATRIDTERLVILEDRDRIARDLHDVVIQRIFASAMTLLSTVKLIDHPAASARIRDTVDDLDDTIRQIRSTIFALQAEHGTEGPTLRVRVHAAVEAGAAALGFMPALQIEGAVDTLVPDPIGQQVVTVLGEALTNVARHAGARHVTVRLAAGDDVTLTVTDDGVGIKPGGRRSGLRNLAERAGALGGTFEVAPGSSGGTVLSWRVPLKRSDAL